MKYNLVEFANSCPMCEGQWVKDISWSDDPEELHYECKKCDMGSELFVDKNIGEMSYAMKFNNYNIIWREDECIIFCDGDTIDNEIILDEHIEFPIDEKLLEKYMILR